MKWERGILLLLGATFGCSLGPGGLGVQARAVTTQKPGMVAAYLAVTEGDAAAAGLTARDFTIYEDGVALSPESTGLVLLDKERAAEHHTLVLIDDSEGTSPERRRQLLDALEVFVPMVRSTQSVSIHAFDGGTRLRPIAEFPQRRNLESGAVEFSPTVQAPVETPRVVTTADKRLRPQDTSRNLHGALVLAEKELTRRLARSGKSLSTGTLVVFSAGPDLARRVSRHEAEDVLRKSPHVVLGISYGPASGSLGGLAKDGYFDAHDPSVLPLAFEEVAYRVRSLYEREYLLAYCSPARSGERTLRIEARVSTSEGGEKRGGTQTTFRADGFGGRCDPTAAPRFAKIDGTGRID